MFSPSPPLLTPASMTKLLSLQLRNGSSLTIADPSRWSSLLPPESVSQVSFMSLHHGVLLKPLQVLILHNHVIIRNATDQAAAELNQAINCKHQETVEKLRGIAWGAGAERLLCKISLQLDLIVVFAILPAWCYRAASIFTRQSLCR
jgi:hypothetical protein